MKKNDKGFTVIELLLAMAIGIIVLGSSIYVYSKQDRLLRDENKNVQMRDFARLAMDELGRNVRLAGYGFPPGNSVTGRPARGLTAASATSITFMANMDNLTTYVNQDSTADTNNWLWVADTTGFAEDDNVVFFDVETPTKWNTQPIVGMNATTMVWQTGANGRNDFNFRPITDNVAVEINKYHTITYTFNSGAQTITLTDDNGTNPTGDDTTTTIANNISDLTFSYFDASDNELTALPLNATDLGDVRRVQVSVTVVDAIDNTLTATLLTDLHLRNMGI